MSDHTIPMVCPQCGYECDMLSGVNHDNEPDEGMMTICLRCVTPAILTREEGALVMRPLTHEEWDLAANEYQIARARAGALYVRMTDGTVPSDIASN